MTLRSLFAMAKSLNNKKACLRHTPSKTVTPYPRRHCKATCVRFAHRGMRQYKKMKHGCRTAPCQSSLRSPRDARLSAPLGSAASGDIAEPAPRPHPPQAVPLSPHDGGRPSRRLCRRQTARTVTSVHSHLSPVESVGVFADPGGREFGSVAESIVFVFVEAEENIPGVVLPPYRP